MRIKTNMRQRWNKDKLIWTTLLILMVLLAVIPTSIAVAAEDVYDDKGIFPVIKGFEESPTSYYVWDKDGFFGSADIFYILAAVLQFITNFLLRISIMVFEYGLHPNFLDVVLDTIMGLVQKNLWEMALYLIGPIFIFSIPLIIKDYKNGQFATMGKRFLTFIIGCIAIGAFLMLGTDTFHKITDATGALSSSITGKMIGATKGTEESKLYNTLWENLVFKTFELGEIKEQGLKITQDEATKINKKIKPYNVQTGDVWARAILKFPTGSDERTAMLGIFKDNHKKLYAFAFMGAERFLIAICYFIAGSMVSLFLFIFGGINLMLFFFLVGLIAGGIITLPMSLIPGESPNTLMSWLKKLLAPVISKIALAIYVGIVSMVSGAIIEALATDDLGYLGAMFVIAIFYLAALVAFFMLISKFSHPLLAPLNKAASYAKKGYQNARRNSRRSKRDKYFEGGIEEEEEDDDDDESSEAPARTPRRKRARLQRGGHDRADNDSSSRANKHADRNDDRANNSTSDSDAYESASSQIGPDESRINQNMSTDRMDSEEQSATKAAATQNNLGNPPETSSTAANPGDSKKTGNNNGGKKGNTTDQKTGATAGQKESSSPAVKTQTTADAAADRVKLENGSNSKVEAVTDKTADIPSQGSVDLQDNHLRNHSHSNVDPVPAGSESSGKADRSDPSLESREEQPEESKKTDDLQSVQGIETGSNTQDAKGIQNHLDSREINKIGDKSIPQLLKPVKQVAAERHQDKVTPGAADQKGQKESQDRDDTHPKLNGNEKKSESERKELGTDANPIHKDPKPEQSVLSEKQTTDIKITTDASGKTAPVNKTGGGNQTQVNLKRASTRTNSSPGRPVNSSPPSAPIPVKPKSTNLDRSD